MGQVWGIADGHAVMDLDRMEDAVRMEAERVRAYRVPGQSSGGSRGPSGGGAEGLGGCFNHVGNGGQGEARTLGKLECLRQLLCKRVMV